MNKILLVFWVLALTMTLSAWAQDQPDPNGYNVFYYPDGRKSSEGWLKDGQPEGWWKSYNEQGVLVSEGNRKNHQLDSVWTFYNDQGEKSLVISYKMGKKDGDRIQYFKQEYVVEHWSEDTLVGSVNTYHTDGWLKKSTPYDLGVPHGMEKEFNDTGLVVAVANYYRGVLVGRRTFGKGLVQEPLYFSDGSGLRLTVSRFYTPAGRCIQKPYTDDYAYDIYKRYADGEVFSADSVKLDSSDVHLTKLGRKVYGGGGIMPDVFVPMDTTRATGYYLKCNKKATQMRFASAMFDKYRKNLLAIDGEKELSRFIASASLPAQFRAFASSKDGITPASEEEWEETLPYLEPQLNALVARYSKLGDNAFYKYYLPIDDAVKVALEAPSAVTVQ